MAKKFKLNLNTERIDSYWQSEQTGELINILPVTDDRQHFAGDECWCALTITKPVCGNCGGNHFTIVQHTANKPVSTAWRDIYLKALVAMLEYPTGGKEAQT